jgi:hypothetical protein
VGLIYSGRSSNGAIAKRIAPFSSSIRAIPIGSSVPRNGGLQRRFDCARPGTNILICTAQYVLLFAPYEF